MIAEGRNVVAWEYKVDYINAEVTDKDVKAGTAGSKVTGQAEIKLGEWAQKGFEFHRSEVISVEVHKTSCFGNKTGESVHINLVLFVFRREVR